MPVRLHHLRTVGAWQRCDHVRTRYNAEAGALQLALAPEPRVDEVDAAPWVAAWRGGFVPHVGPEVCSDERPAFRLGDLDRGVIVAENGAWRPLGIATQGLRGLADDACGRMWGLSAPGTRVQAFEDRSIALAIPLPFAARTFAISDGGVYAAEGSSLAFGRWGRSWRAMGLQPGEVVIGLGAWASDVVALVDSPDGARLLRLEGAQIAQRSPIDVPHPVSVNLGASGVVWVPVIDGPPPRRTRLVGYVLGESGASPVGAVEIGRFDGRGLVELDGVVYGSTPTGWVRGYRVAPSVEPSGRIETFALDSERHGCTWHRVFLDVCLPTGTGVRVWARTSDTLPPDFPAGDARPRPAQGLDEAIDDREAGRPLGSLSEDDEEGWVDVGALDRQPLWIDRPAPPRGELPTLDPLPRGDAPVGNATHTLEGLLKNPPGRYLWLRIQLAGRRSTTPSLGAVRVYAPRPSLLAFLPAWWRDHPEAQRMQELLALFEAPLTRIEERVDTLPSLLDPRATPPEALDWLASFVAVAFEPKLPERIRRTLLAEATTLYRTRGTLPSLERLCTILAETPVRVIEAWRLRRGDAGILGESAVMGQVQLDGVREPGEDASEGAIRAWFRASAHRFQVVVIGTCTTFVEELLERAIEMHKPAHTVHTLCFADAMRVGSMQIGLTTRPSPRDAVPSAVTDQDVPLGATVLARPTSPLPHPPRPPSPEPS